MVSTASTTTVVITAQQFSQLSTTAVSEMLQAIGEIPVPSPSKSEKWLLEYVSANPNGPITAVHGRGGVVGDALSRLLTKSGRSTTREFYVNDANASRQMRQFARAVLARYRQLFGQAAWQGRESVGGDAEGYPDEYITRTAQHLIESLGDRFVGASDEEALPQLQESMTGFIRQEQEKTLANLGVHFDNWFSENALHTHGAVQRVLQRLKESAFTYEQSGALWLRSTEFGDEADRVLLRADGSPTYLAGDLAYHADKFDRGFDGLVDIWSADHAGYRDRTRAGLAALGYDPERLHILLLGPVRLLRDGTELKGSRIDGLLEVATLTELLNELPREALRFAFLSMPSDGELDIDVDRLQRLDRSNPIWTIGYARSACRWALENAGESLPEAVVHRVLTFPSVIEEAISTFAPEVILDRLFLLSNDWLREIGEGPRPAPVLTHAVLKTIEQALDLLEIDIQDENA